MALWNSKLHMHVIQLSVPFLLRFFLSNPKGDVMTVLRSIWTHPSMGLIICKHSSQWSNREITVAIRISSLGFFFQNLTNFALALWIPMSRAYDPMNVLFLLLPFNSRVWWLYCICTRCHRIHLSMGLTVCNDPCQWFNRHLKIVEDEFNPSCLMVSRSGSLGFVDCIFLPEMDAWVTYPWHGL